MMSVWLDVFLFLYSNYLLIWVFLVAFFLV